MRILVTNDDGIDSPGLHALAQRMTDLGEVIVFAPSSEHSGAGAAIGHLSEGVPAVHTVERPEMPDVAAVHHIGGPPALAALLACRGLFGPPPDLVVSGINPGWNVGWSVLFSGTVGACLTARVCGVSGIAVSQRRTGEAQRWEAAAELAATLVPEIADRPAGYPVVWSVNVPNVDYPQIRGVRRALLADRLPYGLHSARLTDGAVTFESNDEVDESAEVDTGVVLAGYASLTELAPTGVGC
ncbi:MAG: 5'/3'-nucleotidase SurE [Acidimicrobiales bacterium]